MAINQLGYILRQDLTAYITSDTVTELTGGRKAIGTSPAVSGDDRIWQNLAVSAVAAAKSRIRTTQYDISEVFAPFYEYSADEGYTSGMRVAGAEDGDGIRPLYACIQDAPAGTLLSDTDFFVPKNGADDDRDPAIVRIICKIIIYDLSARYNPREIPEQRRLDYEEAQKELRDGIQMGHNQYEMEEDVITPDDPRQAFAYGTFEGIDQDVY